MLGETISITYDAVAKVLSRVKQDGYGAEYYLDDSTKRFTVIVKHTVPPTGKAGENHLVRLDIEHITDSVVTRKSSSWSVIRTDVGLQDSKTSEDTAKALTGFLNAATITKIVGRQS